MKMSKKVKLVLLSSLALGVSGCSRHQDEGVADVAAVPPNPHGNWWYFHSSSSPSGFGFSSTGHSGISTSTSSGFKPSAAVSSRGGFGTAGHAFGASS